MTVSFSPFHFTQFARATGLDKISEERLVRVMHATKDIGLMQLAKTQRLEVVLCWRAG